MSKLVAKVCPDEKESGKKEKVKSIKIPPAKTSNQNGLQHRFLKGETFESAKNPPKEVGPPMSEYTEKYKFNEFYSEQPLITDMSPMAYCKINDIARTAQSKADIQYGGKTVLLDPYVSTSHMSYHYKSPESVDRLNKMPKTVSRLKREKKSMDTAIRTPTKLLPNYGMESEAMASYGPPVDELCHLEQEAGDPPPVWNRLTKGEVMAIPAMYQSEYSIYGSGISLRTIL